ncbi:PIN domain-containing protein [Halosimplex salinum]|uniref:PIN domain-containing protein n=1 Tax=Halosimplex salinum TaxID=1710538 RepID=UPI000F4A68CD|nr:PIN domain-containing protein [Halosimplex salinum]
MILDTDFLIALGEDDDAEEKALELETADVPLRVPAIVLQELYVAVGAGENSNQNARKFEALVANKPLVDIDENIARRAGVLEGQHLTSDEKPTLGPGDALVAATALQFNEPVVTSDGDFKTVDGLAVETF